MNEVTAGGAPSASRSAPATGEELGSEGVAPSCFNTSAITRNQMPADPPGFGGSARSRRPRNPALAAAIAEDPQLGRQNYHKRHGLRLARHLNAAGLGKRAARIGWCSRTLCLDDRGRIMYREACHARGCPMCQSMRAAHWSHRLRAGLLAMLASEAEPLTFAHLTLTVRNCAVGELRDHTRAIHRALERMTRRAIFPAIGAVRNTEVSVNLKAGTVHPHVHMLLVLPGSYFAARWHKLRTGKKGRERIVPGYMTQPEYVALWQECARLDYAPAVHIQAVNLTTPRGRQALYEVAKYGVKPASLSGMPAAMLPAFFDQLHHTRAIAVTGLLRRYVQEPEEEDGEREERTAAAVATWDERARRYIAAPLVEPTT